MPKRPPIPGEALVVQDEYDIIALRQGVRQVARTVGLDLAQQARITAAISAVTRDLIHHHWSLLCTIMIPPASGAQHLAICCTTPRGQPNPSVSLFERIVRASVAASLVDQTEFSLHTGLPRLLLGIGDSPTANSGADDIGQP